MKKALITGITGQDGSFLAEFLLAKGYDVHGTIRRSSVDYRERIAHLEGHPHFHLHYADLGDSMSILQVVKKVKPNEIYNLAAQSHVQVSFDSPEFTADVDATGVLRILEAVRQCDLTDTCRIYQASTSELYGKVEEVPQNEDTPFHPYSPYAVAKLYGYWIIGRPTICSAVRVSCSIMRANAVEKLSLPARLHLLPLVLRRASRKSCIWEIFLRCATGDMLKTMWSACG